MYPMYSSLTAAAALFCVSQMLARFRGCRFYFTWYFGHLVADRKNIYFSATRLFKIDHGLESGRTGDTWNNLVVALQSNKGDASEIGGESGKEQTVSGVGIKFWSIFWLHDLINTHCHNLHGNINFKQTSGINEPKLLNVLYFIETPITIWKSSCLMSSLILNHGLSFIYH